MDDKNTIISAAKQKEKAMEFQLPSLLLLFSFLLYLYVLLNQIIKRRSSRTPPPPPGPWRLPLVGSLHHIIGSPLHLALHKLSTKHGPVVLLRLGQMNVTIISSPEAAKVVMKTHDTNFCSRPLTSAPKALLYEGNGVALAPYDAQWRQHRRICTTELLTARRVKSFTPAIQEEISSSLRRISSLSRSGARVNLSKEILSLSNRVISKIAFGVECKQRERFISAMKESMVLGLTPCVVDYFPRLGFIDEITGIRGKLRRLHRQFDGVLDEIIRDRVAVRSSCRPDGDGDGEHETFLDLLLRLRENSDGLEVPFHDIQLKALIQDMFLGGTETGSILMEWAMSELMKNPPAMQKAQEEVRRVLKENTASNMEEEDINGLKYLMLVIKETLRLHPPFPLLPPRLCKEPCEVLGYEVPAGSTVIVSVWTILRDAKHWEDAESFKPERFESNTIEFKGSHFEYIPFGAGRRICPGQLFVLNNAVLVLAQLLYYFNWELPDGGRPEDLDMSDLFGASMGRKTHLQVIATPCIPLPVQGGLV